MSSKYSYENLDTDEESDTAQEPIGPVTPPPFNLIILPDAQPIPLTDRYGRESDNFLEGVGVNPFSMVAVDASPVSGGVLGPISANDLRGEVE